MGLYQSIRTLWRKPTEEAIAVQKQRLIKWRREPVTLRIDRPTRLDRARSLGYRAKQGIFMIRQRVLRGGHRRPKFWGGRRPKHSGTKMALRKGYRIIAEERASKAYPNCEVLNSYYTGKDGIHFWYEVIMVDRSHPSVAADARLNWIVTKRGRAHRGLTSAGKKSRALHKKGKGVEKARPSRRANKRLL